MPITGSAVYDENFRLRFFVIIVMGLTAFAAVAYWRGSLLFAAEYQEMPFTHQQMKIKKQNEQRRNLLQQLEQQRQLEE